MSLDLIEYRHIPSGQIESRIEGDQPGTFSGYACRWNIIDSYGTRFQREAWVRGGLDEDHYGFLFMHDPKIPIGVFLAREDDEGLWIEGVFDDTTDGADARKRAKSGSASELSVGFIRTGVDPDDPDNITAARLVEVSLITRRMASQPNAELAAVRAAVSELEDRGNKHKCTRCGKFVTKSFCGGCSEERSAKSADNPPTKEEAEAVDLTDEDLTDEQLPEVQNPEDDSEDRSVGKADALHDYWTKGEGLAKWADKPHPWTALYKHLLKYIKVPAIAKATAAKWFHEVKGYWPGDKKDKKREMTEQTEQRMANKMPGSYEDLVSTVNTAFVDWAQTKYSLTEESDWYAYSEATFVDYVIGTVSKYSSPHFTKTWQIGYERNQAGEVLFGEAKEVELVAAVRESNLELESRKEDSEGNPDSASQTSGSETGDATEEAVTDPETPSASGELPKNEQVTLEEAINETKEEELQHKRRMQRQKALLLLTPTR